MALAASTVYEARSTATSGNVNGGGFNPANTNFSTNGAATSATGSSPVFTSATYTFVAGDVGAWLFIKSGTNWTPGWYQIASVSAGAATLQAASGTTVQVDVAGSYYTSKTTTGCATTASPTGATWSIDYSQQDAGVFSYTDIVLVTTTTMTSAAFPFTVSCIGNLIHINSGTNFTVGWYEITNVVSGTATVDRAAGTAASTGGVAVTGGAFSLGAANDSSFLNLVGASSAVAPRSFIKKGTYTVGQVLTIATGTTAGCPVLEGYNTIRGDRPTIASGNQPIIDGGSAFGITVSTQSELNSVTAIGSRSVVVQCGTGMKIINCKVVNYSTTANFVGITLSAITATALALFCEFCSYRGIAVSAQVGSNIFGCYIHDSVTGLSILTSAGSTHSINNNLFIGNTTALAVAGASNGTFISNNTFYGGSTPTGTGISYPATLSALYNNIIYGFTTGISSGSAQNSIRVDYNNFFNNTADTSAVTNIQKGSSNISANPQFAGVTDITFTGGTSSGSVMTATGGNFTAVVPGRDYLRITSATGATLGIYGITASTTTTLTTDLAIGTGSAIVGVIITGRNFAVGTNMKALGAPSAFSALPSTTSYIDLGGAQRQEQGGGSGGVAKMAGDGGGFAG